jgi:hypothetical protein
MPKELPVRHAGIPVSIWRLAAAAIAAALVALPSSALAQQRRQFGAKVGPSFTSIALAEDDGHDYHPRIAASGGGFIALPLAPRVSIQLEAMSSPKGARQDEEGTGVTQTLMLRYFEVPALVRVRGPILGAGVPYFLAGPYAGVRTSAKTQLSAVISSIKTGVRDNADARVERFESGLIVGAGLDIAQHLVVEGRYSHGLTNVNRVADAPRFTNHGFSFTTGVRF